MSNASNEPDTPRPAHLKPHRGLLMQMLGFMSLIIAPIIVAPITWLMARSDLKEMDEGRMDPAGREQTATARLLAMISTITWPIVLSCCCAGMIGKQAIYGGPFISAIGSRRITANELEKVEFGMNEKEVTQILGPPARARSEDRQLYWYWYDKSGRSTFNIHFDERGRVIGRGADTPD
jgi:hypothetical protein